MVKCYGQVVAWVPFRGIGRLQGFGFRGLGFTDLGFRGLKVWGLRV